MMILCVGDDDLIVSAGDDGLNLSVGEYDLMCR